MNAELHSPSSAVTVTPTKFDELLPQTSTTSSSEATPNPMNRMIEARDR